MTTKPLTPADLAAIEERCEADAKCQERPADYVDAGHNTQAEMDAYNAWWDRDYNLAKSARTDVPALLAEVRRLGSIVDAGFGPECDFAAIRESGRAATAEADVRRLELAVSGYRRDVDNCLMELKARNTAIRDREVEISRLQADNERMRRGLEYISKRGPGSVDGECTDCDSQCVDQARAAVNLLAGREWNNCADGAKERDNEL